MSPDPTRRLWAYRLAIIATVLSIAGLTGALIALARQAGANSDTLKAQCIRGNQARADVVSIFRAFETEILLNPKLSRLERDRTRAFFDKPLAKLGPRRC